jgi:hypothetical protein
MGSYRHRDFLKSVLDVELVIGDKSDRRLSEVSSWLAVAKKPEF